MKIGNKDEIPGGALFKKNIDNISKAAHNALITYHDEEWAYVLYYRIADTLAREMKKKNVDKKYLDLFKDLLIKSTTTLEDLGRSLTKRYEEKQKLIQEENFSSSKNRR